MFEIALLNPLRFIDTSNINFGFDGNFAIDQVLSYQNPQCYFQKWDNTDVINMQILSDFVPRDLVLRDLFTDIAILTIPWQPQATMISGYSFTVYEFSQSLLLIPEGKYYFEFGYLDENDNDHVLISEPCFISDKNDNTTLLKYKHAENDFDIIFDTNIEFQFRVESAIKDYMPGTVRNVYTDQLVNPTNVYSVPYRKFKYFIGYGQGVPDWVFDKVVQILTVDTVKFNNVTYQVVDGADYEAERNDDNNYIAGNIDVQPTDNKFSRYKVANPPDINSFIPMQKVLQYYNQSGPITVTGVFKNKSLLEKICVSSRTATTFTLNIDSVNGGSSIGSFDVKLGENVFTIEEQFLGTATVYLTGYADVDIDVDIIYKQLDEKPISLLPAEASTEGKGSVKVYVEAVPGELSQLFNLATGLGDSNGLFKDWAWMDGRNGTPDWSDRVPIMMDNDTDTLGDEIGNKNITLTKDQLPAVGLSVFTDSLGVPGNIPGPDDTMARVRNSNSQSINYEIVKGVGEPTKGRTAKMGIGASIDITPKGVRALWIMKIA